MSETSDQNGGIGEGPAQKDHVYDVGKKINDLYAKILGTYKVEEKTKYQTEIFKIASEEYDLYPLFEAVDVAAELSNSGNRRDREIGNNLVNSVSKYLFSGEQTPVTKLLIQDIPSHEEETYGRLKQMRDAYFASSLKSPNMDAVYDSFFENGNPTDANDLFIGVKQYWGENSDEITENYQQQIIILIEMVDGLGDDLRPESANDVLSALEGFNNLKSADHITPILKNNLGLSFNLSDILNEKNPQKAKEMAAQYKNALPKGNYVWKHLSDNILTEKRLELFGQQYRLRHTEEVGLEKATDIIPAGSFDDSLEIVGEEITETEQDPLKELDVIERKLEEITEILGISPQDIQKVVKAFTNTYTNLFPQNLRNGYWQGKDGHQINMRYGTLNNMLGLTNIGMPEWADNGVKNGTIPFDLGLNGVNDALLGSYRFNDGHIGLVGDNENHRSITSEKNPLLYGLLSMNVLGGYLTHLMARGDVRQEVASHQINKTKEFALKSRKMELTYSLFNNSFPGTYLLLGRDLPAEEERITKLMDLQGIDLDSTNNFLKGLIEQHKEEIGNLFANKKVLVSDLENLDGLDNVEFSADDSGNVAFHLKSENAIDLQGTLTQGGEVIDFDADLSKTPALKKYFDTFFLIKYVQCLQEAGYVTSSQKIDEQFLVAAFGKADEVFVEGMSAPGSGNTEKKYLESAKEAAVKYDAFFEHLTEEEKENISDLSKDLRTQMWQQIPEEYRLDPHIDESELLLTEGISSPNVLKFVAPFDTFLLGKGNPGVLMGFGGPLVTDGVTFMQRPVGEMSFSELPSSVGIEVAKLTALSLYINHLEIDGKYDHDTVPDEITSKEKQFSALFEKAMEGSIPEYRQKDVDKRFRLMEPFYEQMPGMSDISDTIRRRFWLDVPQRYKTSRWMEDSEALNDEDHLYTRSSDMERFLDLKFSKRDDNLINVEYVAVSTEGSKTPMRGTINQDGTVTFEGIDKEEFPNFVKVESDTIIEKYFACLSRRGLALQSDSLSRSIDTYTKRKNEILKTTTFEEPQDFPESYLDEIVPLNLEHGNFLWEQIPQEYRNGRWLLGKGEQKGVTSFDGGTRAVTFSAGRDGANIEYEYDIPSTDGKKYTARGIIELDGQVLGEYGQISDPVARGTTRVRVLDSLYSNLLSRNAVEQTPEVKQRRENYLLDVGQFKHEAAINTPKTTTLDSETTIFDNAWSQFEALQETLDKPPYPEIVELLKDSGRRIWLDIPDRFKSSKWMDGIATYNSGELIDSILETDLPKDKLFFSKDPKSNDIIITSKTNDYDLSSNYGGRIKNDGSIEIDGIDPSKYPLALEALRTSILESYYKMLEAEGHAKRSDSFLRFTETNARRARDISARFAKENLKQPQEVADFKQIEKPTTEQVVRQLINRIDVIIPDSKRTELYDALERDTRSFWINLPDRFKSGIGLGENTYTLDDRSDRARLFQSSVTYKNDPESNAILGEINTFGNSFKFKIDRNGEVEIDNVNKEIVGPSFSIFKNFAVEKYYSALLWHNQIAENDSVKRSNARTIRYFKSLEHEGNIFHESQAAEFPVFHRNDTMSFIPIKDVDVIPGKREEVEKFIEEGNSKLWNFVPPEYRNAEQNQSNTNRYFNVGGSNPSDPWNGSVFRITPSGGDDLNFHLSFEEKRFRGSVDRFGKINVKGLNPETNPIGIGLANTSVILWYLGLLEQEGKLKQITNFAPFWVDFRLKRDKMLQESLTVFNEASSELQTGDVQPANVPKPMGAVYRTGDSSERAIRKRIKTEDADKAIASLFDFM